MNATPLPMPSNMTQRVTNGTNEVISNNTLTFIVGFGILILFILVGILASAFLCMTLKKDPYLWEVEHERQLQEKADSNQTGSCKERERDKLTEDGGFNEVSTQM